MAVLKVLTEPDPRLRIKSVPVETVDKHVLHTLDDMYETMVAFKGCGLSAPQVNIHKRLVVMQLQKDGPIFDCINPEILWSSAEVSHDREGCLSVPTYYASVSRFQYVDVRFLDRKGKEQRMRLDGIEAVCMQHEIDHLNGILFIDYLSAVKRMMALRHVEKALKT